MSSQEDDLNATKTEGYKVGEKKTLEEYQKLGKYIFLQWGMLYVHSLISGPEHTNSLELHEDLT
jgi:hypothetical protein